MFAVRIFSGARQRGALPCVFPKTHGEKKRTANKIFAVRFCIGARQTQTLPCVFSWRTANTNFAVRFLHWRTVNFFPHRRPLPPCPTVKVRFFCYLCRAPRQGARQTHMFAVRFPKTHGKVFLKMLIFVLLFISPLQQHFCTL
jgi:hypothetical protein